MTAVGKRSSSSPPTARSTARTSRARSPASTSASTTTARPWAKSCTESSGPSPYTGPKIGFNPDDRFMLALGQKLAVVTTGETSTAPRSAATGSWPSSNSTTRSNPPAVPAALLHRARLDRRLPGRAPTTRSTCPRSAPIRRRRHWRGRQPVATTIPPSPSATSPPTPSATPGGRHTSLMEFDLPRESDWPRSFVATLLIVEEDNGDLAEAFRQLETEVGETIKKAAEAAATTRGRSARRRRHRNRHPLHRHRGRRRSRLPRRPRLRRDHQGDHARTRQRRLHAPPDPAPHREPGHLHITPASAPATHRHQEHEATTPSNTTGLSWGNEERRAGQSSRAWQATRDHRNPPVIKRRGEPLTRDPHGA